MNPPRLAIFLHVYHLDRLPVIDKYLKSLTFSFDLWVNFVQGSTVATKNINMGSIGTPSKDVDSRPDRRTREIKKVIKYYQEIYKDKFYYTLSQNRGMDPAGFIVSVNCANRLGKKYDYICKIHTKTGFGDKNPFTVEGKQWGIDLYETLLGSDKKVDEIINIFKTKPSVGMISCVDYLCGDMGNNQKHYDKWRKKFGHNKAACFPHSQNFIAGTMFWVRGIILDFFKRKKCSISNFEAVADPIKRDGTSAHAFERLFPAIIRDLDFEMFLLPTKKIKTKKPKIISFYFPQFHQMPENDYFWGKGFTEWDNLKKAQVKQDGQKLLHPHKNLGYYDLTNKKIRRLQGELAKEHGIYGFCYHHYWFSGRKVMWKPTEMMLADGYPDLPFCLNWANEPWTKNWDGKQNEVLLPQNYGDVIEWDKHFNYLLKFFKHEKYIKINNKPVFLIYRIGHINEAKKMIRWWNTRAQENGFDGIYIIQCLGSFAESNLYYDVVDSVCEFQPNFANFQHTPVLENTEDYLLLDIERSYQGMTFGKGKQKVVSKWDIAGNECKDYGLSTKVRRSNQGYYNGFSPSWDNTPRRQNSQSTVFVNKSDENYKLYLTKQLYNTIIEKNPATDEKLLFMNSWNEWGEGCVMEPDNVNGDFILKKTKEAVEDINKYYIKDDE